MAWNLTEEEQGKVMTAISLVIEPWQIKKETTQLFIEDDGTERYIPIEIACISDEAPAHIKMLDDVYTSIIDQGAFAGGIVDD